MNDCLCIDCSNKCYEYRNSITCNKAYYEWTYKEDKCKAERSKRDKLESEDKHG